MGGLKQAARRMPGERAAQEASKLQESYKDGTLASPLAERLSLDAVSASLKEGRQKLREGVETAIEAGADASRRTMDAMGENERVDEVIKSKNARILALEEERAKHRHALAEAVKAAKQKAEELDLVKERAVARFKVLQDEKTQSDGARAALQAELDRPRAAALAPPLIDLAGGGGGGRDDDDFDRRRARAPLAPPRPGAARSFAERDAALADLREKGREMLTALQAEKAALAHQLSEATTARQAAEAAVANASSAQQAEAAAGPAEGAHTRARSASRGKPPTTFARSARARPRSRRRRRAPTRSARRRRRRSAPRAAARRRTARRSCARGTRRRRRTWRRR